jgi:hypothetical protein
MNTDPEIVAIGQVYDALKALESSAQRRVIDYVTQKLGLEAPRQHLSAVERHTESQDAIEPSSQDEPESLQTDETDGISPVAQKWIRRSSIPATELGTIFSLGGDDIDLIARNVPGESKKERMHSVLLLKAMAAYLATGAPRAGHKEVKEACLHYDAWDGANFANLKSYSSEIGGSKDTGYTLNARGLSAATELIRSMIGPKT